MTIQYRQGDVLIRKIDSVPADVKRVDWREEGRVILAHGETTGHAHALALSTTTMYRSAAGQRYLEIKKGAELTHEEHGIIAPQPGCYEVIQQREYTPAAIRNVVD